MKRHLHSMQPWLLMILIGLLTLLAIQITFADDSPPAPTATPAPLLPNTPPTEQGSLRALVGQAPGTEGLLPEPFPATTRSEQELQAIADEYVRHGAMDQLTSDENVAQNPFFPQAIPAAPASINLPFVQSGRAIVFPPTVTPTPEPDNPKSADVAVALWAEPSIRVARNGTLTYEIRVRNYGRGSATQTRVSIPFNRSQIVPIGSQLNTSAGDWVSELTDTSLTVTFGHVGAGEERSGKVLFRVAANLSTNTVIGTRANYRWDDQRRSAGGATNWAPVLVGAGNDTAAYVWLIVDPTAGNAATTRGFYSDRFLPGEGVTTWLNIPGGTVKPLSVRGSADQMGRVWMSYQPSDLVPGTYQLVAYGNRSKLTGVVSFVVR